MAAHYRIQKIEVLFWSVEWTGSCHSNEISFGTPAHVPDHFN
ncbi:MAG TPA: hypothetical protein VK492_12350 [Chitinophagaceae bacterium]|nr:hypothetical protein [Chitinophagaceae bacterium]